ncbi:MAG TPA: 50S ribosomal protein L21, partial [Flexilinea sp.]|nr:50S ribosomal protein L21 [Flexilinea sp.]
MKYAIIESGGKQYKAIEGAFVTVDRLEAEPGSELTLDQVLLVVNDGSVSVGSPVVKGATVKAV